jgi:general secretion pathway protein C
MGSLGEGISSSMRLGSSPRAERLPERLVRRLPRPTVYSALEVALLVLIAVQAARLLWILVTPVGPVGEWKASGSLVLPDGDAALREFDPFFRLSGAAAPAIVTSLSLKLYGVTEDRATGRGSAIIALPDGTQRSFAVGEEIMPGVVLAEVGFDNVAIDRAGAREQIFLDQSEPAQTAAGAPPSAPATVPGQPQSPPAQAQIAPPTPSAAAASPSGPPIRFQPRMTGGRVDGIMVSPGGSDGGAAFRSAGFVPGDVIVSVNGQRVTSTEQARALIRATGGEAILMVDRGGQAVSMRMRTGQ